MSVLSLTEPQRGELIHINDASRERAIRLAVTERCRALNLGPLQTDDAIAAAMAERAFGGSPAKAVAAGQRKAERTAAQMKAIRTRFGTRPDGPPEAA